MKPTSVRRTALAASAAALTLLVTACGGDGEKADEGKGASEPTAAPAPAAKALTGAELEKAALAQSDVEKGKVAAEVPASDDLTADQVKAEDGACLPLARAQAGVAQGDPAATAKRSWTGEPKKPAADTDPEEALGAALDVSKMLITLASYEDGGAEKAMKGLSAAAEKCTGGFKTTTSGEKLEIAKVATTAAPKGGDESAAITLTLAAEGGLEAPNKVVAVRKGSTVVTFTVVNLAAMADGKDFEVPADVVDAQVSKLG
ncbi:hypothetical protein HCJ93_04255 [Streptomyces sp. SBST2-5]|uniref:Lipoprotein n=1 Tax=Streptomyces composti TaxID=2720025 RepID=A0ABX1A6D4_9ACTN|nr:hypothetical protein [Streptomyces composti]NJP49306.1 hypothetical protein [Streptomyces composti]